MILLADDWLQVGLGMAIAGAGVAGVFNPIPGDEIVLTSAGIKVMLDGLED